MFVWFLRINYSLFGLDNRLFYDFLFNFFLNFFNLVVRYSLFLPNGLVNFISCSSRYKYIWFVSSCSVFMRTNISQFSRSRKQNYFMKFFYSRNKPYVLEQLFFTLSFLDNNNHKLRMELMLTAKFRVILSPISEAEDLFCWKLLIVIKSVIEVIEVIFQVKDTDSFSIIF